MVVSKDLAWPNSGKSLGAPGPWTRCSRAIMENMVGALAFDNCPPLQETVFSCLSHNEDSLTTCYTITSKGRVDRGSLATLSEQSGTAYLPGPDPTLPCQRHPCEALDQGMAKACHETSIPLAESVPPHKCRSLPVAALVANKEVAVCPLALGCHCGRRME